MGMAANRPDGFGRPAFLLTAFLLQACAQPLDAPAILHHAQIDSERHALTVCHGFGCNYRTRVRLMESDWQKAVGHFSPAPANAAAERRAIGDATGDLRMAAGTLAGTTTNRPGSAIVMFDDPTQMDCVDEASNTHGFLVMLEQDGLLRFHHTGTAAARGSALLFTAHNTATIIENTTGTAYAVDPWLSEMGQPAAVMSLHDWLGD